MFYTFIATDPCYNEYAFKAYKKKENANKAFESAVERHFGLPFDTLRAIYDEIESHKGNGEYEAFYTGDDEDAIDFVSEFNQPVITENYASVLVEDGAFLMTWAVEGTEFED